MKHSYMSVSYGRYVISFDNEERMWNADPKAKGVVVNDNGHKVHKLYTFPQSQTFVEKTKEKIAQRMREEGVTHIRARRGEWVAHINVVEKL